jgi:hypothetical protein
MKITPVTHARIEPVVRPVSVERDDPYRAAYVHTMIVDVPRKRLDTYA